MPSNSRRASDADLIRQEDADRSKNEWRKLDVMSLKLKCNNYNLIATGKKEALVTRLHDHFRASSGLSDMEQSVGSDEETHPYDDPSEILDLNIDGHDDLDFRSSDDEGTNPQNGEHSNAAEHAERVRGENNVDEQPENQHGDRASLPDDSRVPDANLHNISHDNNVNNHYINVASVPSNQIPANPPQGDDNPPAPPRRQKKPKAPSSNPSGTKSRSGKTPHERAPLISSRNSSSSSTSSIDQKLDLISQQTKATHSEIRNVRRQQQDFETYVNKQIKSLRTHVDTTLNNKPPSLTPAPVLTNQLPNKRKRTSTPPTLPLTNTSTSNTINTLSPSLSQDQNHPNFPPKSSSAVDFTLHNVNNQGMNLSATTNTPNPDPWAHFQNPFLPPSIKETHLKKIELQQFVDLPDLHPENQATEIAITGEEAFIMVDKDSGSGLLRQKDRSHKKVKIDSFQRWVTVWNIFNQAHLHYHPADYYNLFTYFSHIRVSPSGGVVGGYTPTPTGNFTFTPPPICCTPPCHDT